MYVITVTVIFTVAIITTIIIIITLVITIIVSNIIIMKKTGFFHILESEVLSLFIFR